jgi:hypothetical protein
MEIGTGLLVYYGERALEVVCDTSNPSQLIFSKGPYGERILQYHATRFYIGQTMSRETS